LPKQLHNVFNSCNEKNDIIYECVVITIPWSWRTDAWLVYGV